MSSFMKISPVGAELFQADGQTDRQTDRQPAERMEMTKLIFAFRNFSNAPKKHLLLFRDGSIFAQHR
jgi:hypothetical protein